MYARENSQDGKYTIGQSQNQSSAQEIKYNLEDKYLEMNCEENTLDLQSMFYQNSVLQTEPNAHVIFNHKHSDSLKSILLPI